MATAVQSNPQVAPATQQAPAQGMIPFPAASRPVINGATLQWSSVQPGTAPQILGPADLVPTGYIAHVEVAVSTATAGTLGPGAATADFPFNIFQNLQFIDAGGQKMDDLPGFPMMLDNIWGGYRAISDPRSDYDYSANLISPNFRIRFERQLFPTGVGCLPNLSGTQKYRLRLVVDALSNIYTTAPTTAPTLLVTINQHEWFLPEDYNGAGQPQETEPPLLGLAQYRLSWYPAISISNAQVNEQVKANGNLLKYIMLIARNSSGVRTDAVFPNPFTLRVDNSYPINNVPLSSLIAKYQAQVRQATQRDTGVLVIPFDTGLGRGVGDNGFASLEQTSTATWIQFYGLQPTPTVGTIDVLVCEISVAEVDPAQRSALGSATGTWNPQIAPTVVGGV